MHKVWNRNGFRFLKAQSFSVKAEAEAVSQAGLKGFKKPLVLCILDGWGFTPNETNNSVLLAKTPNFDAMWSHCSQRNRLCFLNASEKHVGLPDGQIGNSETGHMNIGAGRVVYQDICRIDHEIETKTLEQNSNFKDLIASHSKSKDSNSNAVHLIGLSSPGGVHAHQDHICYAANHLANSGVKVCLHLITDGRDVPPQGARDSLPAMLKDLHSAVKVCTLSGRYYAMDRDKRWERTTLAFDAIAMGKSQFRCEDAMAALNAGYDRKENDEFIKPTLVGDFEGIKDGDSLLMMNFRNDRARQILHAFVDKDIIAKNNLSPPKLKHRIGLVSYSAQLDVDFKAILEDKHLTNTLGEIVSRNGKSQLRIAETEKYPHVTFFFNGGREEPFKHEDRILIPSQKVATYDLAPEMSSKEIGKDLCNAIENQNHDLIVVNFAAPDMVGHTGDLGAAIVACEVVDECLGKFWTSLSKVAGNAIVTADHGNCEQMWDKESNAPHTAHTLNKVPCLLLVNDDEHEKNEQSKLSLKNDGGSLCDLAPTILQLLKVQKPKEMSGRTLLKTQSLVHGK